MLFFVVSTFQHFIFDFSTECLVTAQYHTYATNYVSPDIIDLLDICDRMFLRIFLLYKFHIFHIILQIIKLAKQDNFNFFNQVKNNVFLTNKTLGMSMEQI